MHTPSAPSCWVLVPAAGVGNRMATATPKQYLTLENSFIIEHTLSAFVHSPNVLAMVVIIQPEDRYWSTTVCANWSNVFSTFGGEQRMDSVYAGLTFLLSGQLNQCAASVLPTPQPNDWVLIHDAARPCFSEGMLQYFLDSLPVNSIGGLLGLPITDTVKKRTDSNTLCTLSREDLFLAQTPQIFRLGKLYQVLTKAKEQNLFFTDESSALEYAGYTPEYIKGFSENIKLTHPEDLPLVHYFLSRQNRLPIPMKK